MNNIPNFVPVGFVSTLPIDLKVTDCAELPITDGENLLFSDILKNASSVNEEKSLQIVSTEQKPTIKSEKIDLPNEDFDEDKSVESEKINLPNVISDEDKSVESEKIDLPNVISDEDKSVESEKIDLLTSKTDISDTNKQKAKSKTANDILGFSKQNKQNNYFLKDIVYNLSEVLISYHKISDEKIVNDVQYIDNAQVVDLNLVDNAKELNAIIKNFVSEIFNSDEKNIEKLKDSDLNEFITLKDIDNIITKNNYKFNIKNEKSVASDLSSDIADDICKVVFKTVSKKINKKDEFIYAKDQKDFEKIDFINKTNEFFPKNVQEFELNTSLTPKQKTENVLTPSLYIKKDFLNSASTNIQTSNLNKNLYENYEAVNTENSLVFSEKITEEIEKTDYIDKNYENVYTKSFEIVRKIVDKTISNYISKNPEGSKIIENIEVSSGNLDILHSNSNNVVQKITDLSSEIIEFSEFSEIKKPEKVQTSAPQIDTDFHKVTKKIREKSNIVIKNVNSIPQKNDNFQIHQLKNGLKIKFTNEINDYIGDKSIFINEETLNEKSPYLTKFKENSNHILSEFNNKTDDNILENSDLADKKENNQTKIPYFLTPVIRNSETMISNEKVNEKLPPQSVETQITSEISTKFKENPYSGFEFETTLNPESLGKIQIKITKINNISKDKISEKSEFSIEIKTEKIETKALITSKISELKRNLIYSGINVTETKVSEIFVENKQLDFKAIEYTSEYDALKTTDDIKIVQNYNSKINEKIAQNQKNTEITSSLIRNFDDNNLDKQMFSTKDFFNIMNIDVQENLSSKITDVEELGIIKDAIDKTISQENTQEYVKIPQITLTNNSITSSYEKVYTESKSFNYDEFLVELTEQITDIKTEIIKNDFVEKVFEIHAYGINDEKIKVKLAQIPEKNNEFSLTLSTENTKTGRIIENKFPSLREIIQQQGFNITTAEFQSDAKNFDHNGRGYNRYHYQADEVGEENDGEEQFEKTLSAML